MPSMGYNICMRKCGYCLYSHVLVVLTAAQKQRKEKYFSVESLELLQSRLKHSLGVNSCNNSQEVAGVIAQSPTGLNVHKPSAVQMGVRKGLCSSLPQI